MKNIIIKQLAYIGKLAIREKNILVIINTVKLGLLWHEPLTG